MSSKTKNRVVAFRALRRFLEQNGWRAEEMPERYAFTASAEDDLCPRKYFFQIVEQEQFLFYIKPVITLLPEMLPAVAEFIARANFGMRIGNFELDYRECEVCFRSSINFNGVLLSGSLLKGVIAPALEAYDEFFPGLARVIAGIESPAKAIRTIEYGEA